MEAAAEKMAFERGKRLTKRGVVVVSGQWLVGEVKREEFLILGSWFKRVSNFCSDLGSWILLLHVVAMICCSHLEATDWFLLWKMCSSFL